MMHLLKSQVFLEFISIFDPSSTFKATILFTEQFNKMGAVGTYSVSATVKAVAEE